MQSIFTGRRLRAAVLSSALLALTATPAFGAFGELNPPGSELSPGPNGGAQSNVLKAGAIDDTTGNSYVWWSDSNSGVTAGVDEISPSGAYLRTVLTTSLGSSTDGLAYDVPPGGLGVDGKNRIIYLLQPRSCRVEAYSLDTPSVDEGAYATFGPVTSDNSCGQAIFDGVGGSLVVNQNDGSMFLSGRLHIPTGNTSKPFSNLPAVIKYTTNTATHKGVQGVYFGEDTGNDNQPQISPAGTVRPPNAPGLALDPHDGGLWVVDDGPGNVPTGRMQKFDSSGNYVSGTAVAIPGGFRRPYNKGFAVSRDGSTFSFSRASLRDDFGNIVTPPEAELVTATFGRLHEFGTPGDGACQFHSRVAITGLPVDDFPQQFRYAPSGQLAAVMNGTNFGSVLANQLKQFGPNGSGCNRPPVGSFTAPTSAVAQTNVTFDASGSHDPDTYIGNYHWDFGDGTTADAKSATIQHAFQKVGNYTVTLTVTDDEGLAGSSVSHGISITPVAPQASFTYSPAQPHPADTVSLDGSGSNSDGSITDYRWDLDGSGAYATDTGTTPTVTTSFSTVGDHTVGLRVTNSVGTATTTRSIHVYSFATASFTYTPQPAVAYMSETFDGSASSSPKGTIVDYKWDLDGSGAYATDTGSTPTVSHTYTLTGTYSVGLRVTDSAGNVSESAVQAVAVQARPPVAVFSYSPSSPQVAQTVTYDGTASNRDGSIVDYRWDLDGSGRFATDTRATPTVSTSYSTTGTRTVSLRVTDNLGRTNTTQQQVTVVARPPVASYSYSPSPAQTNEPITFDGSASNRDASIVKYQWDFDGSGQYAVSSGSSPTETHTFTTAGTYNVGLKVTDDSGRTATTVKAISVAKSLSPTPLPVTTPLPPSPL